MGAGDARRRRSCGFCGSWTCLTGPRWVGSAGTRASPCSAATGCRARWRRSSASSGAGETPGAGRNGRPAGLTDVVSVERPRVAVIAVHTSPIDQPGTGDSGGMNVYIRSVAERLAELGVAVDLFTRCRGGATHDVREIAPGIRVVSAKGGPCHVLPKSAVPRYLPEFLGGVLRVAREDGNSYDLIHSHYWLSGWVGRAAREILEVPLVASFHTRGNSWACTGPIPSGSASSPQAWTTRSSSRRIETPRARGCTCPGSGWPCSSDACSPTKAPTWRSARSPRWWPGAPRWRTTSSSPSWED